VVSGELDPVGGKAAVEQVSAGYKTLGLADVEAKIYTGDRHEILNEDDRETVYRDLAAWILARI
ncbi:MAG: alpha/beta hydrolase, partial [Lachnospiraceae bacterium]|nr:alpha/beta hydrolase [Lachnospiraceae bacterium]